jgi:stage II sporulation protein M
MHSARLKITMSNFGSSEQRLEFVRLRPFAVASVLLFCAAALAGGMAIVYFPQLAAQLQELLKQFAQMFRGLPKLQLAIAIFFNNSLKTLLVILLGPLFGIAPVIFLVVNGAILGAVIPVAAATSGLWRSIMTIVPHGILELPAIFLGTSIGLKLGMHPWLRLAGKADTTLMSELGHGLRLYFTIILPLLLLAAAIEVYVTPLIAGLSQ